MKIVEKQFEKIISSRRNWEKKCNFSTERNVIENFNHFKELIDSTLLGVPIVNNLLHTQLEKDLIEYHFLMKVSIAFNLRFYDKLCVKLKGNTLYSWKQNKEDYDLFILLLWKQNLFSVISSYSLIINDFNYQGMQLLRGYIESSAILYLSLLDFEFLSEYTSSKYSEEEYMKIWFKKLKPSKVKATIKNIHNKWNDEDHAENVEHIGLRSMTDNIIISDSVENLYKMTSNYMHFNKKSLLDDSYSNTKKAFGVGLNAVNSIFNKKDLICSIIQVFSFTSSMLEAAIRSHKNIIKYNELMGDFSELNVSLQNECGYEGGMYTFNK